MGRANRLQLAVVGSIRSGAVWRRPGCRDRHRAGRRPEAHERAHPASRWSKKRMGHRPRRKNSALLPGKAAVPRFRFGAWTGRGAWGCFLERMAPGPCAGLPFGNHSARASPPPAPGFQVGSGLANVWEKLCPDSTSEPDAPPRARLPVWSLAAGKISSTGIEKKRTPPASGLEKGAWASPLETGPRGKPRGGAGPYRVFAGKCRSLRSFCAPGIRAAGQQGAARKKSPGRAGAGGEPSGPAPGRGQDRRGVKEDFTVGCSGCA